jgi:hypothetical protein
MATTTGLVQRVSIMDGLTCVWIGPSPTNTAVFQVQISGGDPPETVAFKATMIDALSTANTARREVSVNHGVSSSIITSLSIDPV